MGIVKFVDETASGSRSDGWALEAAEERLTVRELIRRRVFQEGDRMPAVILSKAVMPADDTKITDPAILSRL